MIRQLSPDSLSIMEFKSEIDVAIAEKLMRFPLLGHQLDNAWNVRFGTEFHMTNDSYLFRTSPAKGRLPLYEGKMIHQFQHRVIEPKYWIDERKVRAALLGRQTDIGQPLDYQSYRLAFRDVARNTDARTAIMTMLPPNVFCNHPLPYAIVTLPHKQQCDHRSGLVFCAIINSLVCDFLLRQRVTGPSDILSPQPDADAPNDQRTPHSSRSSIVPPELLCTTPEFDDLAEDVGFKSHKMGVIDETKRALLRAELDGLIAHLYGLTEAEFRPRLEHLPHWCQQFVFCNL